MLLECVPNISEGANSYIINQLAQIIRQVPNVYLLHIDIGKAANRTVFTFVGEPNQVIEAAFQLIKAASQLIDMQQHKGEHPRIGAVDVCPLIPIKGISMAQTIDLSKILAKKVGELGIPTYLYEHSAMTPERRNLASIRTGEYENLAQKIILPAWKPDFGAPIFNAKSGATVIGARDFLIAYNVNLNTDSVEIAKQIAAEVRESGRKIKQPDSTLVQIAGKCKFLKAIGWYIKEYGKAQVSMNLTNVKVTGMHHAYEACAETAQKYGVRVTGSELIGMTPLNVLLQAGRYFWKKTQGDTRKATHKQLLDKAIDAMGLSELAYFDVNERIIEYKI